MKVGYARVSSMDQNLDRQLWEIRKAGAEKIFQEKLSGKSMNSQVELQQALQFLREKDVLVIESLDRLGRNYAEIVQIVQKLDRKKIGLQILNMPILNQDMGDPNLQQLIRNMILQILSWTAQNEREEIKRQQKQGTVIA